MAKEKTKKMTLSYWKGLSKDSKKRAKNTILFAYMGEKSYLYTEKTMHNEELKTENSTLLTK